MDPHQEEEIAMRVKGKVGNLVTLFENMSEEGGSASGHRKFDKAHRAGQNKLEAFQFFENHKADYSSTKYEESVTRVNSHKQESKEEAFTHGQSNYQESQSGMLLDGDKTTDAGVDSYAAPGTYEPIYDQADPPSMENYMQTHSYHEKVETVNGAITNGETNVYDKEVEESTAGRDGISVYEYSHEDQTVYEDHQNSVYRTDKSEQSDSTEYVSYQREERSESTEHYKESQQHGEIFETSNIEVVEEGERHDGHTISTEEDSELLEDREYHRRSTVADTQEISEEIRSKPATLGHEHAGIVYPGHLRGLGVPTVVVSPTFDVEQAAMTLHAALEGRKADKKTVVVVLTKICQAQRAELAAKYQQMYGTDLSEELRKELSGDFSDVIYGLFESKWEILVTDLLAAMKGAGTDERTLTEILCTLPDEDIQYLKACYQSGVGASLQDSVYDDTSGSYRKVLLSVLAGCREDPNACSEDSVAGELCQRDAKGRPEIDETTLRTVLVSYTRNFLYGVSEAYRMKMGEEFSNVIQKVCKDGDARQALLAIYNSIVDLPSFYATELRDAMKGMGTKDSVLKRIIILRSEVDLYEIKEKYKKLTGKTLHSAIKSETSGDYRDALLSLLEGNVTTEDVQRCMENLSSVPFEAYEQSYNEEEPISPGSIVFDTHESRL